MTTARVLLELARARRTIPFVARGGSMWPAIPAGSVVEIVPCDPAMLRPGDIGAFERSGRVVVHRVVSVKTDAVRFRGDAVPQADGDIPFAQVLGRARVVRRRPLRLRWPTVGHLVRALRAASRRAAR
jgi:hypothetical protein